MLEIFFLSLPFIWLAAAVVMLLMIRRSAIIKQAMIGIFLLALLAFANTCIRAYTYRKTQGSLPPAILEELHRQVGEENYEIRQLYLRDDLFGLYAAAFLVPFGA